MSKFCKKIKITICPCDCKICDWFESIFNYFYSVWTLWFLIAVAVIFIGSTQTSINFIHGLFHRSCLKEPEVAFVALGGIAVIAITLFLFVAEAARDGSLVSKSLLKSPVYSGTKWTIPILLMSMLLVPFVSPGVWLILIVLSGYLTGLAYSRSVSFLEKPQLSVIASYLWRFPNDLPEFKKNKDLSLNEKLHVCNKLFFDFVGRDFLKEITELPEINQSSMRVASALRKFRNYVLDSLKQAYQVAIASNCESDFLPILNAYLEIIEDTLNSKDALKLKLLVNCLLLELCDFLIALMPTHTSTYISFSMGAKAAIILIETEKGKETASEEYILFRVHLMGRILKKRSFLNFDSASGWNAVGLKHDFFEDDGAYVAGENEGKLTLEQLKKHAEYISKNQYELSNFSPQDLQKEVGFYCLNFMSDEFEDFKKDANLKFFCEQAFKEIKERKNKFIPDVFSEVEFNKIQEIFEPKNN